MKQLLEKYEKHIRILMMFALFAFTLKCFSLLLKQHFALIEHPYQVELREGASLFQAKSWAEGVNPYLLENQPWYADNFGLMYPLVAQPFIKLFGLNLFSMRLLSAIAIFLSMVLVFLALFRQKAGWVFSFAGTVIFYACVLYYVTPICRADALATFFFVASVILPVLFRFSNWVLLLSGILAILSFYTKQYGILGFPIILAYMFLFVSMRKALIQALSFGILLAVSMWWVATIYPCYFYNTTASMAFATDNNFEYSWMQMELMLFRYLPGLFFLVMGTFGLLFYEYRRANTRIATASIVLNFKKFNSGLFASNMNPYLFAFIVLFMLLLLKLGGNQGTFMSYHFQLLAFLWLIVAISFAAKPKGLPGLQIPLLAYAVFTSTTLITSTGFFKQADKAGWEKAIALIKENKQVLNDQSLATEMMYAGKDTLYNTGLVEYFFRSTVNENFNKTFPFTQKLIAQGDAFKKLVRQNVREKKFDVLLLNDENDWIVAGFPVNKYYTITDSLYLDMYHTSQHWKIDVWKPIAEEASDTLVH